MMAAIESAEGVLNAREIAKASERLIGIAFRSRRLRHKYENQALSGWTGIILCPQHDSCMQPELQELRLSILSIPMWTM